MRCFLRMYRSFAGEYHRLIVPTTQQLNPGARPIIEFWLILLMDQLGAVTRSTGATA